MITNKNWLTIRDEIYTDMSEKNLTSNRYFHTNSIDHTTFLYYKHAGKKLMHIKLHKDVKVLKLIYSYQTQYRLYHLQS